MRPQARPQAQADERVAIALPRFTEKSPITSYTDHARKVSGSGRRASSNRRSTSIGVDNPAVRAWAASNGVELSTRGRIPAVVIEKYRAAGN